MVALPLIYGFRELVAGNGFVAGVEVNGRALLRHEDEQWWAYGVEPGGIAAAGSAELDAYSAFRAALREVLIDSAVLTASFEEFREDVRRLGAQANEAWSAEWEAARLAVRSGELVPEGDIAELPRQTKDTPFGVSVVRLDDASERVAAPSDNAPANDDLRTAA